MHPPDNAALAELLARAVEEAEGTIARAYRRAARRAFTWPVEAADLHAAGSSLRELAGVGPFLERELVRWIDDEVGAPDPPSIRANFLTLTHARRVITSHDASGVRGDLQMHTTWSDGGSSLEEMAYAAADRGYEYVAVTDHSAGLRIVKGLDEAALVQQALELATARVTIVVPRDEDVSR